MSNHHANHVFVIGKVIQSWIYDGNRVARVQMKRTTFMPPRNDGHSDLVNVVLPDAIARGMTVENGQEVHVRGFIRSEDRETPLQSIVKDVEFPKKFQDVKVRQIVTEVVALDWQIVG
jgi:hypothetical protein